VSSSDFKPFKFNDFVKLNRGFDLPDSQIIKGDYPVVASTSIKAWHKTFKVKGPAVVTGRSGSLGFVQYINEDCWPLNTALYVKDFKGNDPKFVYYFLKCMRLENFNSGAGVPTLNQNHLHKLPILVPELKVQRKIAAILSSFDDLIENNKRRIAILEKMTEEIYREWFVRLRFPSHEKTKFEKGVPQGWHWVKLGELGEVKGGKRLPEGHALVGQKTPHPYIKARDIRGGRIDTSALEYVEERTFDSIRRYVVNENDVCVTIVANIGDVGLVPRELEGANLTENAVKINNLKRGLSPTYLAFTLNQSAYKNYMESVAAGAAQSKLGIYKLNSIKILLPAPNLIELFDRQVVLIRELINSIHREIQLSKQCRDLLLPRLVSGKLLVSRAELEDSQTTDGIVARGTFGEIVHA
jgi:type I restriction enzyme S subunit